MAGGDFTLKAGDAIPELVAMPAEQVGEEMRVWAEVDRYDRIVLTPYACGVTSNNKAASPGVRRINMISPEEGAIFVILGDQQLVLVERASLPDGAG